jgi:hypothetical protein
LAVDAPTWVPTYDSGGGQVPGHILRGSRVGHGAFLVSGAMRTTDFATGSTGWSINADGSVEFNSGDFRGDITGATGTFSGTVSAGSIHIPSAVAASSFHVDISGQMWLGATSYAAAPFKVSAAGALVATSATIVGGAISGGTIDIGTADASFHVDALGRIWSGHADYTAAPFKVSATGAVTATNISDASVTDSLIVENGWAWARITNTGSLGSGGLLLTAYDAIGPPASDILPSIQFDSDTDPATLGSITFTAGSDALNALFQFNGGHMDVENSFTAGGSVRANSGGVDGGLIMRPWLADANYMSLGTNGMTGQEYCLLADTDHTFISASSGGSVFIRGGANSTTYQIEVSALGCAVKGKLNLTPIDATNEGGELVFEGAGGYPGMNLDVYQHQFRFLRGGSTVDMLIDSAGNAYNRGGSWGTISDPRIKENIRPADPRRAQIRALDVVDYELIDRSGTHRGVDASAARLVFPELVETLDDKEYPEGLLAVKTSQLTWELLLLVQELETRVEILEA